MSLIKDIDKFNRPREKMAKYGISSLTDEELLALVLRTGSKGVSVLDLAKEVINYVADFANLDKITYEELIKIKGISTSKASIILALFEIVKRTKQKQLSITKIDTSLKVYEIVKDDFSNYQEEVLILFLDYKFHLICKKKMAIGSKTSLLFPEKEILMYSIRYDAQSIAIIHNHPSGNPMPSDMDIYSIASITQKADSVGIAVFDAIIVCDNSFYSFKEQKKYNV